MGYNTIDTEKVAGVAGLPEFMDFIGNECFPLYAAELHIGTLGIVPYDFGLGTKGNLFSLDPEPVHDDANDVHRKIPFL
jgi:hypothetical protein